MDGYITISIRDLLRLPESFQQQLMKYLGISITTPDKIAYSEFSHQIDRPFDLATFQIRELVRGLNKSNIELLRIFARSDATSLSIDSIVGEFKKIGMKEIEITKLRRMISGTHNRFRKLFSADKALLFVPKFEPARGSLVEFHQRYEISSTTHQSLKLYFGLEKNITGQHGAKEMLVTGKKRKKKAKTRRSR